MELGTQHPASSASQMTSYSRYHPADISLEGLTEGFTAFGGGADVTPHSAFPSPASHNYPDFDMSSSHSNIGTVSPVDLLVSEPLFSAPNSTAFSALTSPSVFNESPDFTGSVDASPLFGADPLDTAHWAPLFGPTEQFAPLATTAPAQDSTSAEIEQSPASMSEDLPTASPGERRKSSAVSSPSGRMSSTAGVGSRRRTKPLPPIEIKDKDDIVAYKRAKNTLAARKSRERKAVRVEELEEKVKELQASLASEQEKLKNAQAERDHWRSLALANGGQ